jgi:uncharacterized protein YdbL (DUF1318 family)
MNYLRTSSLFTVVMFLTACVTINIYFPAAQAEEAAREMVKDILGTEEAAPAEGKESALKRPLFVMVGEGVLNFLIPAAHAAEPDFNVNTPEIRKLQAQMKKRMAGLKGYFASGAIGFTRDALVGFHNNKAVPLKERAKVKKMISAENKDRNNLYKAIAKANGHPEWEKDVRKTYARIWVDEAAKGWWYQDAKGKWQQK